MPAAARRSLQAAMQPPRPFLKWAGGKRRLLPTITSEFPDKFDRYFEPFLGGGSVLFHILSAYPSVRCYAYDTNPELIGAYETVRDDVDQLVSLLRDHADRRAAESSDCDDHYYEVRAASPSGKVERAARMLFLNQTCFNGLYRVNSNGEFNVPPGRYPKRDIVREDLLRAASSLLSSERLSIRLADFEEVVGEASGGDLVYMDPPYQPTSPTAGFTMYTRDDFGYGDLERLADVCDRLDSRRCRVLLSNSDAPEVKRLFSGETVARAAPLGQPHDKL